MSKVRKFEKFIREAHNRLQWDGIWEDSVPEVHQKGDSLHNTLDMACEAVKGDARFILVSWAVGMELLKINHNNFKYDDSKSPFRRDLKAEREDLMELGYLGTYRDAIVIASIYLGVWEKYCIVSSAFTPSKISYEGPTTVLVRTSIDR